MRLTLWLSWRRVLAIAAACGAAVIVFILFVPPPLFMVERLTVGNGDWLLSNYMEGGGARSAWRKIKATYIQYGLASAFRRTHVVQETGNDAERLMRTLVPLRATMLNQGEVEHAPMQWAPLVSGLGFCDQVNAMAANVLGATFDHVQIVALIEPKTRAQHTIGRVWSARESAWLYFDLWGDVSVFRLDSAGAPVTLAHEDPYPGGIDAKTLGTIHALYAFSKSGATFNEYPATFGGFLFSRARRALTQRTMDSFAPASAIPVAGTGKAATAARFLAMAPDLRREYASAHTQLVLGRTAVARIAFEQLASRDNRSVLGQAAAAFAQRLRK